MLKYLIFACIFFILFSGCATKVEIVSFTDDAFVKENLPISIDVANNPYPLLSEAIKNELEKQIIKDDFLINEQNASYLLDLELLSHDRFAYRRYEPSYHYSSIKCAPNGECYRIPRVVYVPCLDVTDSIHVVVRALNIHTNETKELPITSREFADSCHNRLHGFGFDMFLADNVKRENIILLAKKIKSMILPVKTIQKERLSDEIKSTRLPQSEAEIFEQSLKSASKKRYEEAILGFEKLKKPTTSETPYEIYLNLGLLYEHEGDLDKALQNYQYLMQIMPEAKNYIKRVLVKKRYEKK
ncbi:MAG: tetratricopeptide repeat protein [Campylobacteraceae bacterium]|jgi:tetratricopeptide (TPR) repeat protein|nr:tetratricopeptide repeat protein [Campylobacteraceae bacterium]